MWEHLANGDGATGDVFCHRRSISPPLSSSEERKVVLYNLWLIEVDAFIVTESLIIGISMEHSDWLLAE